ncbi:MAG: hypothetical protein FJW31_05490 [Acidobacteria bacterium]|nr:hypothetical protein [Acidobacteriota bacterium]
MRLFCVFAAAAALVAAQSFDLIVKNARVWTGDAKNPWADSLAVQGDILAKVGGAGNAEAKCVIDAGGRLITPGFIDSHVHLSHRRWNAPGERATARRQDQAGFH